MPTLQPARRLTRTQRIVVPDTRPVAAVPYRTLFQAVQAVDRARPTLALQARIDFFLSPAAAAASAADALDRPAVTLVAKTCDRVLPLADDLRVDIPFTQAPAADDADLRVTGQQSIRNLRLCLARRCLDRVSRGRASTAAKIAGAG